MVRHTGSKVHSPASVVAAIESALGRQVRLFGQSTGDQGIVALTRHGMERLLDEDATDPLGYVMDHGGRNYDCENFAETLRSNLARKHGVNGCTVIWATPTPDACSHWRETSAQPSPWSNPRPIPS